MKPTQSFDKQEETAPVPSFEALFDIQTIQTIQDAFATSMGVGSIITDTQGHPLTRPSNFCRLCKDIIRKTQKGRSNCIRSDAMMGQRNTGGPVIQQCLSSGLWDAGISINVGGNHIANWLIGQVRNDHTEKTKITAYAATIGADQKKFNEALEEVTVMPLEKFKQISESLFLIANQLSELAYQKMELKQIGNERREMESRLRQSQKMEAIGTLAGGIAHDFNNILFPVIGFAEMIDQDLPDDSPMKAQIKGVLNGAYRAKDLVQQILTFSRRTEQEYSPLKVQFILKEVLKLSRSTLPSSIKIYQDIPATVGRVMADPTQIHQIAMNLITNALHAMEEKGGELTVKLKETDFEKTTVPVPVPDLPPGPYVCLEVTDTGDGMDEETVKRIFEPYFTTKVKGKGTGLGLAVVHGIIKSYHGKIMVHSTPGMGTSFFIYLPRIVNEKNKTDACVKPINQFNGTERLLVVDDEKPILMMLEKILTFFGYQVSSYVNSLEALDAFRNSPEKYDMVLTDMTMPDLTGEKLILELKKIRPTLPAILLTGFSKKIAAGRTMDAKPDRILMKPVLKDDLLGAIRNIFDGR